MKKLHISFVLFTVISIFSFTRVTNVMYELPLPAQAFILINGGIYLLGLILLLLIGKGA